MLKHNFLTLVFFSASYLSLFSQNTTTILNTLYENVTANNGKIKISGTLVLPDTTEKCPAILMIHGSGKATKEVDYAEKFAQKGIAVLTYDKRGCGESEGKYEDNLNVSTTNLNLLANDALAMLSILSNHKKIDQKRIGLWGISQAGWILPIVLSKNNTISFAVMLSAPVVKVSEEIKFSMLSENKPSYLETHSNEQIEKDITSFSFPDIYFFFVGMNMEPKKYLKNITVPILWLYGSNDNSIPISKSIKNIESLKKANHEIRVYTNQGHGLKSFETANQDTIDWILSQDYSID